MSETSCVHMSIALTDIGVGLVAALGLTRLMMSLLYEVQPNDAPTLIAMTAALGATALLVSWGPALRAALIDPASALRHE